MKQGIVFFFLLIVFLTIVSGAVAATRPGIKFNLTVAKGAENVPSKCVLIYSEDSTFSHCDRFQSFNLINAYGPIREWGCSADGGGFWKLKLYQAKDSLESNVFTWTTLHPTMEVKIDTDKVTVSQVNTGLADLLGLIFAVILVFGPYILALVIIVGSIFSGMYILINRP